MSLTAADLEAESSVALPAAPSRSAAAGGEALRYLIASVLALGLDVGLLWVGTREFGLAAGLAGGIAYFAGLVLVYGLSVRWVFAQRAIRDARGEFALFAALGLVGLVLNSLTLFVATDLGLALPLAKALSAAIGFVANFVSRKVLLFSRHRS